jgi:hypothetical protein
MRTARGDWGGITERLLGGIVAVLLSLTLSACGGGGGGGDDEVIDDTPPAPGGTGTGAGGVPVFWKVLAYNQGYGRVNAVVELADGSLVAAGFMSSSGSPNDVYIAKTDRGGQVLWERRLPVGGGAIAYALRPLSDGGFMLAGTIGDGATARGFVLRTDAAGNALAGWPKHFGDSGTQVLTMTAVPGASDGFVLAGVSGPNPYVARIDAAGNALWTRTTYAAFCPGGGAMATTIVPTNDDRFAIAGRTGCSQWAAVLMKIDASGNELWRQVFDDTDPARYAGFDALIETPDGGLLAAGRVGSECFAGNTVGQCDVLLIKTDASGSPMWSRRYGGAAIDGANGLALADDGDYLVGATTRSYGGAITDVTAAVMWDDLFLIKVSPDGSTLWQKVKGVRPRALDATMGMASSVDGGFVVVGEAGGNPLLVKFDKNGATVNLGASHDLTATVPATTGLIGFGNAVEVAGGGASALLLPPQVGGQLLELLIAASQGASPAAYCDGGGTYAFEPAVPTKLVAGGSWTLTFSQCTRSGGGDPIALNGTASLTLNAVSGEPGGSDYSATLTATAMALTVDEPGTTPQLGQRLDGGLRIQRAVTAGSAADQVGSLSGGTLTVTETENGAPTVGATIGPFSIRAVTSTSGALRAATAGDSATLVVAGQTYTVAVTQAIELARATVEPTGGVYTVRASDNSRLTATLAATTGTTPAAATLAIDTDGDGTDDGSLSVPWEFIY